MHDIAVATENLSPSHQYVPWIVMDGAHTDDIENKAMADLTALVCETYKVKHFWWVELFFGQILVLFFLPGLLLNLKLTKKEYLK